MRGALRTTWRLIVMSMAAVVAMPEASAAQSAARGGSPAGGPGGGMAGVAARVPAPIACQLPLVLQPGRVDPRFGVTPDSALGAIRAAAAMWDGALGRSSIAVRADSGIPVHFTYDARFERELMRRSAERALAEGQARYDAGRAAYDSALAAYTRELAVADRAQAEYRDSLALVRRVSDSLAAVAARRDTAANAHRETLADYETRMAAYERGVRDFNAEVSAANARGGATRAEAARLDSLSRRLEAARVVFEREAAALNARAAGLDSGLASLKGREQEVRSAFDRLNERRRRTNAVITALRARAAALDSARGPLEELQGRLRTGTDDYNRLYGTRDTDRTADRIAGHYVSDTAGARVEVFTFRDGRDLVLVLAHEVGHALGLDHAPQPTAVMHPRSTPQQAGVTADDRALWQARCPGGN